MIEIKEVTKRYGLNRVLDAVTFDVQGGEFVSIVGASGAGKTTLVHTLIGAEGISDGKITVDDYVVSNLKPKQNQEYRRRIGIIFQDYKLLPQKTVYENIAFALEVAGYPKSMIQKRTMQALKMAGLEGQRNSFPRQLSGGEAQRTAVARALVHAPELIIADEPTGNLDNRTGHDVSDLLMTLNREQGTTLVMVTHDERLAARCARQFSIEAGILSEPSRNTVTEAGAVN
jgi:putative ABC transport system ATP-binding protein